MNTKHTPGPWHVGKRFPAGAIYDAKGGEVCGFSNLLHPAEIAANARLIAAAPDLADALRVIIKQAETTRLAFPNAAGRDDWQQVILIARAALAKAEGGA